MKTDFKTLIIALVSYKSFAFKSEPWSLENERNNINIFI